MQKAVALGRAAPPWQRAYIEAVSARYAAVPPANRAGLDSAYSKAMRAVAKNNPNDLDAVTLAAESMMDLRPWNYWTPEGKAYPGSDELVSMLESVIARNPQHPGACHYYIHAVEAVKPELAVPCAERLAQLMPGEGHMVHMPAHIYVRVGRYADAAASNVHAIHTDETFIEGIKQQPTVYSLAYYPHNIHFLAFVSTMAGRSAQAILRMHRSHSIRFRQSRAPLPPMQSSRLRFQSQCTRSWARSQLGRVIRMEGSLISGKRSRSKTREFISNRPSGITRFVTHSAQRCSRRDAMPRLKRCIARTSSAFLKMGGRSTDWLPR